VFGTAIAPRAGNGRKLPVPEMPRKRSGSGKKGPGAWGFFGVWVMALARRIRLEEDHLRDIFGPDYMAYAARAARLIPGVY